MPQYEQKTDSREFEVANPDSPRVRGAEIRLRMRPISRFGFGVRNAGRSVPLTWKTDSVLVYMIADLVGASHGRIVEESLAIMAAHFDGSRQALVAAKRIQTSILEFLACRPGERIGAAILIYRPRTTRSDRLQRRDGAAGTGTGKARSDSAGGRYLQSLTRSSWNRGSPGSCARDTHAETDRPS